MRQSLDKIVFVLILAKITLLESRPIFDGCSCAKSVDVPLVVNFPVAPPPLEVPCNTHGYKIEIPPPPVVTPPKCAYSMDMVVEAPLPVVPPPVCNPNLYTPIVKPVLPSPDCECGLPPSPAPCGVCGVPAPAPLPEPLPVVLPQPILQYGPALAALKSLPDDFSGVVPLTAPKPTPVTYTFVSTSLPAAPAAPLLPAYSLPLSELSGSCGCDKLPLLKSPCRYVSKDTPYNLIFSGRSKRAVPCQKSISEIRGHKVVLKTNRVARKAKKSKVVKRDIKGEYDLLQRDQAQMDLTIPEIIQYMPETMMPNFKRGKCNIGCKNCINNDLNKRLKKNYNYALPTEITNKENDQPKTEQQEPPTDLLNENTTESPNQHFDMSPKSTGENYLKRSVNPFQNPDPSCSEYLPPPFTSTTRESTKLAQNPGNPIWYQPQPLTDTNIEYVYDRLGHKYKVKSGSFELVTPEQNEDNAAADEAVVNTSTHVASVENAEKTTDKTEALESSTQNENDHEQMREDGEDQKMLDPAIQGRAFTDVNAPPVALDDQKMIQTPIVGAPAQQGPHHDAHMDKIIRDIVYRHPDFIDATQHAPGSLTLPEDVTRDETMLFLDKLIRGRLNKWFGSSPSEDAPMHSFQDLNRYSRESGASIKFIPIVTVDKDRLDKFRQTKSEETAPSTY